MMCKLAEEKGERKEVARKAAQEKKEAKRQAEAMAKQKAQAALTDCATPQKRPQKQGGSIANKAKVQGRPLLPVAPSVPKRCPAPAPSQRLGCSKCRWSVKGCLECCPLKHAAWKERKLGKTEPLKKKVEEEEEELLKTQAKKVKTQAKTLVPA